MTKKSRKQRQADQLGMPIGTAKNKLQRALIWKLLLRAGDNVCDHCEDWISRPEDLAITHVESWLDDDPSLFWDYDNVAFMHPECATKHGDVARQEGTETMNLVNISIEDERGERLPAVLHQDKLYVIGKKGDRYSIRVENNTGGRIEFVATVDGRDVITGKVGSRDGRGYVLDSHESHDIQGFRKTDDAVAAFRFGGKKDSYSDQMGTGAHVGVIGVAVYREKERSRFSVLRSTNGGPQWSGGTKSGVRGMTMDSMSFDGDAGPAAAGGSMGTEYGETYSSDTIGVSSSVAETKTSGGVFPASGHPLGLEMERERSLLSDDSPRGRSVRRRSRSTSLGERMERQKLGTEYGEELSSAVGHTTFQRRTNRPELEWLCEYDTARNLAKRGVPVSRARRKPVEEPSAFPADAEVSPGYASPPPNRRY
jgi:hypothetical protein